MVLVYSPAAVMAAVANPRVRVMVPLYWPPGIGPESNGKETSRAGATTRFG